MKISTRGRYATRVLLELAMQEVKGVPVLLKDISRRQEIPLLYLEHLIAPLKAAGMVSSARGARGGVWLAKPSRDIRLNDIIHLMEGSTAPVDCVTNPGFCNRSSQCATRDVWGELDQAINSFLGSITLHDLAERQRNKETAPEGVYCI